MDEALKLYNIDVLSNPFIFEDRFNKASGVTEPTVATYDRSNIISSMNKQESIEYALKGPLK